MIDAASPEAGAVPGERYSVFIVPSENQEKSFYHAIRAIGPPTEGTPRPGDVPGAYLKVLGTVNCACEGGGQTYTRLGPVGSLTMENGGLAETMDQDFGKEN